jgi:hypothetical protein
LTVHSAGEKSSRLEHLVPGIVDRRGRVITTAHQREFIRELRVQRENLGNLDIGIVRADRFEGTANLTRRIRLHVPGIELAGRTEIENHDDRLLVIPFCDRTERLQRRVFRHGEPNGPQRSNLQKIPARQAVARRDRSASRQFKHT